MTVPRYYLYKCVVDDGGAPCVSRGHLSLAICKPAIRRTADKGDIVFAFGSNNGEDPPNRLVYIAVVSQVVRGAAYYVAPQYASRPDCIYRRLPSGEFVLRDDARFHTNVDRRPRDLGNPPDYPNACTILSDDFRYFGASGTDEWKAAAPNLTRLVQNLGEGHRVKLSQELRDELRLLKERVWRRHPHEKVLGKPLHAARTTSETPESDEIVEVCGRRCDYLPKGRRKQRVGSRKRAKC